MDQDYAAYLLSEAASDLAALHQFKILYSDDLNELHLFFEGDDDSLFYMPEIRRKGLGRRLHIYVCGGKKNVIKARDELAPCGYDMGKCLFFVDRDFDDYCGTQVYIDERTYLTDNYAIENDVISSTALEIVLDDIIKVSRADPEFNRIVADFSALEAAFSRVIRPFMAWSIATKAAGLRPNFNNIAINRIISVDAVAVSKKAKAFETFWKSSVIDGQGASATETLQWLRLLDFADRKKWIRGKFYMWFFQVAALASLRASSDRRVAAGGKAWKVPATLRDSRLFELLGGRLPPPQSLATFLDSHLEADAA